MLQPALGCNRSDQPLERDLLVDSRNLLRWCNAGCSWSRELLVSVEPEVPSRVVRTWCAVSCMPVFGRWEPSHTNRSCGCAGPDGQCYEVVRCPFRRAYWGLYLALGILMFVFATAWFVVIVRVIASLRTMPYHRFK